jgi:uncharacterized protein
VFFCGYCLIALRSIATCSPGRGTYPPGVFGFWQLAALFGTGLAAGFVDSIAGGGGLLTLPVLLSLGLEPKHALGTNKLQATFGSGSAAFHYAGAGAVPLKDCVRGFLLTLVGAALGTAAVQSISTEVLKRMLPPLLLGIAIYMLVKPQIGSNDHPPRMPRSRFDLIFGLVLGFYDGFLGPGTGTFWTMAFVLALGFNLTRATAYTKVMNLASNLSSLIFFLIAGKIYFIAGLAMGAGQMLGARLGAGLVIKRGTKLIRPIFISMVLLLIVKLLYSSYLTGPQR